MDTEVLVRDLRLNEAQMRTRVGVAELARLAVQVSKGLDPNLPLLLRPDGQGAFTVISGHLRWLALMIAFIAIADLSAEPDLEGMQATIERLCPVQDGFVMLSEGIYADLVGQVPETLTVPFQLWDGPKEDEILLLIKANSAAEEPDLVGQARAYNAAIDAGVSYEQLAQVTGQPMGRLKALVLLLALPAIFQALVNDGLLNLPIVIDLTGLPQTQIQTLAEALEARVRRDRKQLSEGESLRNYTRQVQLAIGQMGLSPSVPNRKEVDPAKYNFSSAVEALWHRVIEEAPRQFYHAVAVQSLAGQRLTGLNQQVELLAEIPKLRDQFDIHEGAYGSTEITLTKEATIALLPDPHASCARCAFIDLPGERVKDELPFACRSSPAGSAFGPCQHWTPKGKKFSLRTPWNWYMGGKVVQSLQALQEAWQAQYDREQKPSASSSLLSGPAVNVAAQRENIRTYMREHVGERFDLAHPWATACARCAHHLDKSPVKADPEAPHCLWAKGKRRLQFRAFVPVVDDQEAQEEIIPFCLQYGPDRAWADIVPEADTEPPFDRVFLLKMVVELADAVNINVYSTDCRGALQFLTGRPAKASDSHRRTFGQRLLQEEPMLSDRQIWTLMQWLLMEWQRVRTRSSRQMAPTPDGGLMEVHVTYFGLVMPGGIVEEMWDDD